MKDIYKECMCPVEQKISIWSTTKVHLNTLSCLWGSKVTCSRFHLLKLLFWSIVPCRSPPELWCFEAVATQTSAPSTDWSEHSRTFKFLIHAPLLPWRCFGDHCPAGRSSHVSESSMEFLSKISPYMDPNQPFLRSQIMKLPPLSFDQKVLICSAPQPNKSKKIWQFQKVFRLTGSDSDVELNKSSLFLQTLMLDQAHSYKYTIF